MLDNYNGFDAGRTKRLLAGDRQAHLTDALKQVVRSADVDATKMLLARGANPFVLTEQDLAEADSNTPFMLSRGIDAFSGPTVRAVRRAKRKWLKGAAPAPAN